MVVTTMLAALTKVVGERATVGGDTTTTVGGDVAAMAAAQGIFQGCGPYRVNQDDLRLSTRINILGTHFRRPRPVCIFVQS